MMKRKSCGTGAKNKLIFACSGAASVGNIADRAARIMAKENYGKMFSPCSYRGSKFLVI